MNRSRDLEKRYFDALKLIHETLKYTDNMNMSAVIKRYKLSKNLYGVLKDGGIIKTNGLAARGCRYEWIGKEPSLEMAIELCNRLNNTDKRPNSRKEKPATKRKYKNRKETVTSNKSSVIRKSFFWGLYTVEKTIQNQ